MSTLATPQPSISTPQKQSESLRTISRFYSFRSVVRTLVEYLRIRPRARFDQSRAANVRQLLLLLGRSRTSRTAAAGRRVVVGVIVIVRVRRCIAARAMIAPLTVRTGIAEMAGHIATLRKGMWLRRTTARGAGPSGWCAAARVDQDRVNVGGTRAEDLIGADRRTSYGDVRTRKGE